MTSPGEFIMTLAEALRLPEPTVAVHDRNLRSAGLRSKSGRGRGAAKVTVRDAAHLLTALLASDQVKDSEASVQRYGETRPQSASASITALKSLGIEELVALPRHHSFIDALEALFASAATGSLAARAGSRRSTHAMPVIEIGAHAPGTVADIRIADTGTGATASLRYAARETAERETARRGKPDTGLQQYRFISTATFLRIAAALGPAAR
jgi:hypothetical protein